MRGDATEPEPMFSYITAAQRVPQDHPLRGIRKIVDAALDRMSARFEKLYSRTGRPSIPPERLLRALLLQVLYTLRSERQLVEHLDYNILFRWFVGLGLDDRVWDATTFTKNRDRLLNGDVATIFFEQVLAEAGRLVLALAKKRGFLTGEGLELAGEVFDVAGVWRLMQDLLDDGQEVVQGSDRRQRHEVGAT